MLFKMCRKKWKRYQCNLQNYLPKIDSLKMRTIFYKRPFMLFYQHNIELGTCAKHKGREFLKYLMGEV